MAASVGLMADNRLSRMQASVRTLLLGLGENADREGLIDTPKRVAKALLDATAGYRQKAVTILGDAFFHEPLLEERADSGLVLVRDIDYASTSELTLLPFHGRCHVAYIPGQGVILGLSKLARLVRHFSKRLQTPAGLAHNIAETLQQHLVCDGVAVIVQAQQLAPVPSRPELRNYACVSGGFAEGAGMWQELLCLMDLPLLPPAAVRTIPLVRPAATASAGAVAAASTTSPGVCSTSDCGGVMGPDTPDVSECDTSGEDSEQADGASERSLPAGSAELQSPGAAQPGTDGFEGPFASGTMPARRQMEVAVERLLLEVGEDPFRQGLQGSAGRYIDSLLVSTSGYQDTLPQPRWRWTHNSAGAASACAQAVTEGICDAAAHVCSACGCPAARVPSTGPALQHHDQPHHGRVAQASWHCPGSPLAGGQGAKNSSTWPAVASQTAFWPDPNAPRPRLLRSGAAAAAAAVGATPSALVAASPLPFSSQCEHHMLPFYGTLFVAYLPQDAMSSGKGCAGGLLDHSELEQVVAMYTRRLQVQERITQQVADGVAELTGSLGVLVMCDAAHMCMVARGVENHAGRTTTVASRGVFERQPELRLAALACWRGER